MDPVFTFLAEALQEIGKRSKQLAPEYYQTELVRLLTQSGWKRRFTLYPFPWSAYVFEKDGRRIIVDRNTRREVNLKVDCHERVFFHKSRPILWGIFREQKWVTFAGRVTGKETHLWFTKGEHIWL